tara:strand:+ start:802 stop:951 length:150 start_codon:yes stop_codon:yes gene_type:complete
MSNIFLCLQSIFVPIPFHHYIKFTSAASIAFYSKQVKVKLDINAFKENK